MEERKEGKGLGLMVVSKEGRKEGKEKNEGSKVEERRDGREGNGRGRKRERGRKERKRKEKKGNGIEGKERKREREK